MRRSLATWRWLVLTTWGAACSADEPKTPPAPPSPVGGSGTTGGVSAGGTSSTGGNRSRGRTIIVNGGFGSGLYGYGGLGFPYPYYGGFGYPNYGGTYVGGAVYGPAYGYGAVPFGYGLPAFGDPYAEQLRIENQRLRDERDAEAQAANRADREAALKLAAERRANAQKDKARAAERAGRTQFAAGQYRRAAERWKEALDGAPDGNRHFLLAQAKFARKRYGEAAQDVRNGLRASPEWPATRFDVRGLYGAEGDFLGQLAGLAAEVKANPLDRDALFLFGYELFVSGRRAQAKSVFDAALAADAQAEGVAPFHAEAAKP